MTIQDDRSACLKFSSRGRVHTSQDEVTTRPRLSKKDGTITGAIYVHGSGQVASSIFNPSLVGAIALMRILTAEWFTISADLSLQSWGNDACVTDIGAASAVLENDGASSGPKIIVGASMGGLGSCRYAASHPEDVAALVLIIPAVDIEALREDNYGGTPRAGIDLAWGVTYPDPLPSADPYPSPIDLTDNLAASDFPILVCYSDNDLVVNPTTQALFASEVGAETVNLGALGHSEAAVLASVPHISSFLS